MQTLEEIPQEVLALANAALAWINESRGTEFELTGLAQPYFAADMAQKNQFELGLVLCDGEICAREQVQIKPTTNGYEFAVIEGEAPDIPPLLDPPKGLRTRWLDEQLEKFDFVLLLFYRGRW